VYENYSFDFSAHRRPIAYASLGNTVELQSKLKLLPSVPNSGGAYVLNAEVESKSVEFDIEFTINSELAKSRGLMALFTQNQLEPEDFERSDIGYRSDYEGVGVYIFRNPIRENKWFVMTLQGTGARSVLRMKGAIHSGMRSLNNCEIDMAQGVRTGLRVTMKDYKIIVEVKDSDDVSYRECSSQMQQNKAWKNWKFALAAKNSIDDRKEMQVTDVDIDSVKISELNPADMYSV